MFEQGYIMREVQKMVQMLQAVTGLKREKKLDEALQKIDESYDRFFDLHSTEVKMDKLNDLIRCCSREGEFSSDLGFALADIIYEEAKILEAQKQEKKADEKFGIVLELYQHSSAEKNAAVPLNAIQKMKKIQQRLDGIKK